ncbi:FMRFamide receptor [Orchesella cincta]|uniref:FMRFamide receptor n=1 Tax=Orchesella cincta TaxID=48709 RepID=A0A1D2M366_ORCCI|nr:FMRFamide receptor [Orchesella cincta]
MATVFAQSSFTPFSHHFQQLGLPWGISVSQKLVAYLLVFSLSTANSSAPHPISQDLWDANVSSHQLSFDNSKWPVLYEINLNAENITSESDKRWEVVFKESSRFWVQYVSLPGVVLIGVIGNGITIHILAKKRMRSSTNVYLTALAVTDLIYLLFSFSMSWRHFPSINKIWLYWYYSPFGLWVTDASSSTSVWLTVSFTVERYIAVCHPLKRKIYCTENSALCVSILVYMACFALTATTPFEWRATTILNQTMESNEATYSLENTEFGKNENYRMFYHWFTTILFVILPLVILAILNYFLIKAVRTSRLQRMLMSNEKLASVLNLQATRVENRVTVTLIAVVILFLICQMPTAIVLIYTAIHMPEQDSEEESVLLGLGNIFNLLVAINAASNFLLYTALCNKYRKHFCAILCFRKKVSIEQQ